ncbi:MAG: nucleoside triphosphate pyrophosphohydrolase [Candidatus Glassbacteria bacterium]
MRDALSFEAILELVKFLRSPSGCVWDGEQDERSLRPYFLEECYELLDAIESGDNRKKIEELGDVLLHCAFQIVMAEEKGELKREDIFGHLSEKMKRRHPHLFGGDETAHCESDWEIIKKNERSEKDMEGVLDGLPVSLPPLLKAYRLQERVSRLNFDWHEPTGAFEKVREELEEVRDKYVHQDKRDLEMEIGDLLFAVVNVSRLLGYHPDDSLRLAIQKFAARFDSLMNVAREKGIDIEQAELEELDAIWDTIKEEEKRKMEKEV